MSSQLKGATFHIQTFGCQMNKHDSERLSGLLESVGMEEVDSPEESDLVVFMTCCVRESADTRLYGQASSLKNIPKRSGSPFDHRLIAIGGCIGQRDGEGLLSTIDNVDIVFGTHNISSLPLLVQDALENSSPSVEVADAGSGFSTDLPTKRENPWSAWLPITVGCNNFCTYCIVPYVRGREKSRTLEDVYNEAALYVKDGVKEITLLGQNVNSYGRDLYGEPRFADMLDAIDSTGIERLRFATSHPKDLSDQVIAKFGSLRSLMPALHLPVQSGSDRVLEMMNRRYTSAHYLGLVEKLRAVNPDIALSTDVIVGFPGETEEDFQQTYDLIKAVGYNQVFTFIYSPREGTPAAKMEMGATHEQIQERFDRLVELVQESAYKENQKEAHKIVEVLVEGASKRDSRILSGKSPKNQTVHAPIPDGLEIEDFQGRIIPIHITQTKTWYLSGEIAK